MSLALLFQLNLEDGGPGPTPGTGSMTTTMSTSNMTTTMSISPF